MMDQHTLMATHLSEGKCFRLIDFASTDKAYRRHLLSLGVTLGAQIKVIRVAPLGCPIQVDVRGVSVALRKEDIRFMRWELV